MIVKMQPSRKHSSSFVNTLHKSVTPTPENFFCEEMWSCRRIF
jgi:hypothetical protein